jgi:hypothetical protein
MRWYHWVVIAAIALCILEDLLVVRIPKWKKRRDSHIRAKELARFNIGVAFRGARPVDKNRFLS